MKKLFVVSAIMLFVCVLFSCSSLDNNPIVDQQEEQSHLKIQFPTSSMPDEVASITATLSREGFQDITKDFVQTGDVTQVIFDQIIVGTWELAVSAYDVDDNLVYYGHKQVEIELGIQTTVDINLEPVSGSLLVNITFGLDTSYEYNYNFNSGDLSGWSGILDADIQDGHLHIWGASGYFWRRISPLNYDFKKGSIEFDIKLTSGATCAFETKGAYMGGQNWGVKMHWKNHTITVDQHDGNQRYEYMTQVPYEDNLWNHMRIEFDNDLGEKGKFTLWMKPETASNEMLIGEFDHLAEYGKLYGVNVFVVGVYNLDGGEAKHAYFDNFDFNVYPVN